MIRIQVVFLDNWKRVYFRFINYSRVNSILLEIELYFLSYLFIRSNQYSMQEETKPTIPDLARERIQKDII